MLGDKIRVGERGHAGDHDQVRRFGQLLYERVAGGDVRVCRLGVGDVGRIIEIAERAFDVDEHGVIAVRVGQRLPHLVHAVCQHGRGDIKALQLHRVRVDVRFLGSGGQDRFKWIVLCVGWPFRRLRGALELLRFVKIHAVWRIHDVAAQIADARENEQAEQNDGQQRDQRNAPQRPLVAVGKNTHGVLLPPVTLPAARRSRGTSPPAVRWR